MAASPAEYLQAYDAHSLNTDPEHILSLFKYSASSSFYEEKFHNVVLYAARFMTCLRCTLPTEKVQ